MINTKQALHRLAILVKNHRSELDMTYRSYSKLFGNLTPNISNIEKENLIDLPSVKTLSKLADILGIRLSELMEYLEYGGDIKKVTPQSDKHHAIAVIKQIHDYDDLLDIDEVLMVQKLKYRRQHSQDYTNSRFSD